MRIKTLALFFGLVLSLGMLSLTGCSAGATPDELPAPTLTTTVTPTIATVPGWCDGGDGLFRPEDVRCYLDQVDKEAVQRIDEETLVLLVPPDAVESWPGAAILFHRPTGSMLVLDQMGDADPVASIFTNRAGLAALSDLGADPGLMAGLKQQLQIAWQATPPAEPGVRLDVAWQDGPTTIFFIAVTGLDAMDGRFYCPGQRWTIGDMTEEILPDCVARDAEMPVNRLFFEAKRIAGSAPRPVQVALDDVSSNVVEVRAGPVSSEAAIYRAVLEHMTNRALIIDGETAPGLDEGVVAMEAVEAGLMENYLAANAVPSSLRFLFHGSSAYAVTPTATIIREYLGDAPPEQGCATFRREYPSLGGIVTLSAIGLSDDGARALVHALQDCGPDDRLAAYYILTADGDGWVVMSTLSSATALPTLVPSLVYVGPASGCGDIFVYKSNRDRTETIRVGIDARALALSPEPTTFDVAAHPGVIAVAIDVYADNMERLGEKPYCNDVGTTAVPRSVWEAVSGAVTVTASASPSAESCAGDAYGVTVLLEDVVFALGKETVRLASATFDDVQVGWCPG